MELKDYREQIDQVDNELVRLFQKRMDLAEKIGAYKRENGLPVLQSAILAQQAEYVKPGGVLVYSTCTVLRRENEAVAEAFLQAHPAFTAEAVKFPENSGIPTAAMTTLLPCDHGTDGFFICKLRRKP